MIARAAVVAEARTWLGTPYQHQQRKRGVAVDCAGLVIGVARGLEIVAPDFDVNSYQRRPSRTSLLEHCDRWMTRITRDQMGPGDVLVIRWARDPQHMGFIGDYHGGGLSFIHAFGDVDGKGKVVEGHFAPNFQRDFVAAYRLDGVAA